MFWQQCLTATTLLLLALTSCTTPNKSNAGFDNSFNQNKPGAGDSPVGPDGVMNPDDISAKFDGIKEGIKGLQDSGATTPAQNTALDHMIHNIDGFEDAYDYFSRGAAYSDLIKGYNELYQAKKEAERIAEELRKAGLADLAKAEERLSLLQPIHRLYNQTNNDHFFTNSFEEGKTASGYNYEGIAFYTFSKVYDNCNVLLNRCLWTDNPGGDHYTSTSPNCVEMPGLKITYEGPHGYICEKQSPNAPLALGRYHIGGHHISTISPEEKGELIKAGYTFNGNHGYTPF